jgi:acyl-CoA synthetase (AMP-forming)/AMP-acid ligase II
MQGIPLVLMSPFDWVAHPALLFRAIQQHRGTLCWLPNFAYNHCARRIRQRDLADISLDSMRLFINCSEPARHDSHELFLKKFASHGVKPDMLSVCYAMAENTFAVTQTKAGAPPRLDHIHQETLLTHNIAQPTNQLTNQPTTIILSCGKPIANTKIKVVAKDGNPLPDRHVGEIMVQSDCMLTNYHQRSDLQPFQNGWYETGDRGYVANGELFVVGRSKDVIINAGKNVYPQDIEAILNHIQGIHPGRVVCFGVPDQKEGTELLAIVAEVDTADADEHKALTRTIRQTVARQTTVTVTYIKLVEAGWLIKTSSGKIARASNRDKWMSAK